MRLSNALYIVCLLLTLSCSAGVSEVQPTGIPQRLASDTTDNASPNPRVKIGEKTFVVDLAISPAERTRGLMGRSELHVDEGMLFIYSEDVTPAFWMKGMLIPLDIVWIDVKRKVVNISENVPTVTTGVTPPSYYPERPIRYVLEIKSGSASENGIRPGSRVEFLGLQLVTHLDNRIE